MYHLSCESLMVARLDQPRDLRALKCISMAGFLYKWMDSSHVLVPMQCSLVAEVSSMVPDVQWLSFKAWCSEARSSESNKKCTHTEISSMDSSRLSTHNTATHSSAFPHQASSSSCSTARTWLDGGNATCYCGVMKSFSSSNSYGFISCPETFARFKRDVFVHSSQLAGILIGQKVSFEITLNSRGLPQAKAVKSADACSWLECAASSLEGDAEECRTTTCTSSDCASTIDVASITDGSCTSSEVPHTLTSLAWLGDVVPVA